VADLRVQQARVRMPGSLQGTASAVLRLLVRLSLAHSEEAEAPARRGHACLVIMAARRHGKAIAGVRFPEQAPCGRSSMAELPLPKQVTRVRFSSSAPCDRGVSG
jgi:hypothetical protein